MTTLTSGAKVFYPPYYSRDSYSSAVVSVILNDDEEVEWIYDHNGNAIGYTIWKRGITDQSQSMTIGTICR
jgi:hypothetical protein